MFFDIVSNFTAISWIPDLIDSYNELQCETPTLGWCLETLTLELGIEAQTNVIGAMHVG
jgi:hypothetical protein